MSKFVGWIVKGAAAAVAGAGELLYLDMKKDLHVRESDARSRWLASASEEAEGTLKAAFESEISAQERWRESFWYFKAANPPPGIDYGKFRVSKWARE